jgi:hypothetical protein
MPLSKKNKRLYDRAYRETHRKERLARAGERHRINPVTNMLSAARHRAKNKNLPFDLGPQDVKVPTHCPVFGVPLLVAQTRSCAPTLDRIDSRKGYVKGNVWVISWRANVVKNDGSWQEHLQIAKAMREREGA